MKQQQGTGRRGRLPKGDRVAVTARVPRSLVALVDEIADKTGVDRTAALTRLLCERLDQEIPSYCLPRANDQTELPLKPREHAMEDPLPKSA
jgi:hypothetical protein